ncbi:MAG: cytochrome c biogenesis protein ResB [Elusimicrobia bacterium]|nr:cytochrome c biogenesis protein ResB [Elusimicrobiota bacterium]
MKPAPQPVVPVPAAPGKWLVDFTASAKLLYWLLPLLIAASILGTLIPQGEGPEWYMERFGTWAGLLRGLQIDDLYHSYWFVFLLAMLAVNITLCSWRRFGRMRVRKDVLVSHIGIIVILAGGMVSGVTGRRGSMPLFEGEARDLVEASRGAFRMPFAVLLEKFEVEYYGEGVHRLAVARRGEAWNDIVSIEPGKEAVLRGGEVKIAVKEFFPDFVMSETGPATRSQSPENPALRLEITDSKGTEQRWVFAKFGDFHAGSGSRYDLRYEIEPARIKQFRSDLGVVESGVVISRKSINVNNPLRWRGYTIYQSGWDPQNPRYSNLLVNRDPGTPLVYLGFILLPLGLCWSFIRGLGKQG